MRIKTLLSTAEAVDVIDKKHGSFPAGCEPVAGVGDYLANVLNAGCGCAKMVKFGLGVICNHHCQRSLANPGWAVKYQAVKLISLEHPRQQFIRAENVALSDKFVEFSRSHSNCKRRRRC